MRTPISQCHLHKLPTQLARHALLGKLGSGIPDNFQQPPPDDEGNPNVQDALISMLKLEIGKKQVTLKTIYRGGNMLSSPPPHTKLARPFYLLVTAFLH